MSQSREIINKLKDNNSEEQIRLIKKYNSRIFLYFRSRIKGEESYEDLVQDVFTSFFDGLNKNKIADDRLIGPFIFGVAKRILYNYFYKKKRDENIQNKIGEGFDFFCNFEEEERLENERMVEIINETMEHLPEVDKIILKEYYLKENNIGEIADLFGKSKHYISVRKVRALKKMKKKILHQKRMGEESFDPAIKIKKPVIIVK